MPKIKIDDSELRDFRRDLVRAGEDVEKEVKRELRDIAKDVAGAARDFAQAKGLRDTGALIAGIKPQVRGTAAFVRSSATRGGFPYPAVHEFAGGGVRAFLAPAVEESEAKVVEEFEEIVDRVARKAEFH